MQQTDSLPVTATVSALRHGEDGDGTMESTDLYVKGRGIALLVNVAAGHQATYSLIVDGQERQSGTIGAVAQASSSVEWRCFSRAPNEHWSCSLPREHAGEHQAWESHVVGGELLLAWPGR